ncbi:MAG: InlB B-repeat-containing protein [Clostridia bacterium]|nr:InlB B-repeat-containing protein [Clostridia bacterium]
MKKFLSLVALMLMLSCTLASCAIVNGFKPKDPEQNEQEQIKQYTVIFDLNGGVAPEEFDESVTVNDGETVTLSAPTKENHDFLGWYLNGELFSESTPITSDITLKALWEQNNIYTITYNTGDKATVENGVFIKGEVPTIPETPVVEGYVFFGWYLDEDLTERYFFDYAFDSDLTLYAKFYDTTLGEYIVISNLDQFKAIKDAPDQKYLLACNINCHGEQLDGISSFNGELDGNGFKIYNFILSSTSTQSALIHTNTGTIKNLYISDYTYNVAATLYSDSSYGMIVATNYGLIDNCHVTEGEMNISATIKHQLACMMGGIVGFNLQNTATIGTVSNCTNRATINTNIYFALGYYGHAEVGGIVGRNEGSDCKINNCTNYGTVNAHNATGDYGNKLYFVGGIVAWNYFGKINNCANIADINHTTELVGFAGQPYTYTGGIAGANYDAVYNCYSTGIVTKTEIDNYDYKYETIDYVGGSVGRNIGIIYNSYSTGNVKAMPSLTLYAGGFIGNNEKVSGYQSIITKSFTTGNLEIFDDIDTPSESIYAGYFLGNNGVTARDCYYLDSATATLKTIVDEVETEKEFEFDTSGIAISEEELLKVNFIENTLCFDRMIWLVVEGKLPVLR